MKKISKSTLSLLFLTAIASPNLMAIGYEDMKPILDRSCTKCHNPEDKKGDLIVTEWPFTYDQEVYGSDAEVVEEMVIRINSTTRRPKPMPPENAEVPSLTQEEKDMFAEWLESLK